MRSRRLKVLVLDDSEIVRDLVRDALERHGYEVVTLDQGLGFNRALRIIRPDLALVDVSMPAIRGDKLVEIAQANDNRGCPIVLFSDRSEFELAELVRSCGAAGFIKKSADTDALTRAVDRFIARRERPAWEPFG